MAMLPSFVLIETSAPGRHASCFIAVHRSKSPPLASKAAPVTAPFLVFPVPDLVIFILIVIILVCIFLITAVTGRGAIPVLILIIIFIIFFIVPVAWGRTTLYIIIVFLFFIIAVTGRRTIFFIIVIFISIPSSPATVIINASLNVAAFSGVPGCGAASARVSCRHNLIFDFGD
jgi:hypothetical protein